MCCLDEALTTWSAGTCWTDDISPSANMNVGTNFLGLPRALGTFPAVFETSSLSATGTNTKTLSAGSAVDVVLSGVVGTIFLPLYCGTLLHSCQ